MMFRPVCVFVICACVGFCGVIAQERTNDTCGIKGANTGKQYPWLVGIEYQLTDDLNPQVKCTGALISRRYVVSIVHCFYTFREVAKAVLLGPYNSITGEKCSDDGSGKSCPDDRAVRIPIETVIIHPEYKQWRMQEIALIRLLEMVEYTDFIRPICLPTSDVTQSSAANWELYHTGIPFRRRGKVVFEKHHVAMTYVNATECQKSLEGLDMPVVEEEICASDDEHQNSCLLPGGVLMNKLGDVYNLAGLLELRYCSAVKVFTNLYLYLDWIRIEVPERKLNASKPWTVVGNPLLTDRPCNGTDQIWTSYEPGKAPEEENVYSVYFELKLAEGTNIEIQFDSVATVTLTDYSTSKGRVTIRDTIFTIILVDDADYFAFTVTGPPRGTVPYFKSVKINSQEYCASPKVGYLDQYVTGYKDTASTQLTNPGGCGRRRVDHTELIVNGVGTMAGDWPWHAAVYKSTNIRSKLQTNYICGGTLISKTMVLTAAHCTTVRGVCSTPEVLSVVLGKYNLDEEEMTSQMKRVQSVIVHEKYAADHYQDNDVALLKLNSQVTFSDYVQPACIWSSDADDRLSRNGDVLGTVVGWGVDQSNVRSSQLKLATMPRVSEATCLKKNSLLYGNLLSNNKKFCAGWANGTSTCNGDSGGGFLVFVPDRANTDSSDVQGSWFVMGIVSVTRTRKDIPLCDPHQYVVFTDIEKYTAWIQRNLNNYSPNLCN